jgi:hypothetical protein
MVTKRKYFSDSDWPRFHDSAHLDLGNAEREPIPVDNTVKENMRKREQFESPLICPKCSRTGTATYDEYANPYYHPDLDTTTLKTVSDGFRIERLLIGGQRKAPCSSRFQNSTSPDPSQARIFKRSAQRVS